MVIFTCWFVWHILTSHAANILWGHISKAIATRPPKTYYHLCFVVRLTAHSTHAHNIRCIYNTQSHISTYTLLHYTTEWCAPPPQIICSVRERSKTNKRTKDKMTDEYRKYGNIIMLLLWCCRFAVLLLVAPNKCLKAFLCTLLVAQPTTTKYLLWKEQQNRRQTAKKRFFEMLRRFGPLMMNTRLILVQRTRNSER